MQTNIHRKVFSFWTVQMSAEKTGQIVVLDKIICPIMRFQYSMCMNQTMQTMIHRKHIFILDRTNVRRENLTNCHCGHNNLSTWVWCGGSWKESDKVGAGKTSVMFKEWAKKKTNISITQQSPDTRPKKGVPRTLTLVRVVAGGLSDTVASYEWTRYDTFCCDQRSKAQNKIKINRYAKRAQCLERYHNMSLLLPLKMFCVFCLLICECGR